MTQKHLTGWLNFIKWLLIFNVIASILGLWLMTVQDNVTFFSESSWNISGNISLESAKLGNLLAEINKQGGEAFSEPTSLVSKWFIIDVLFAFIGAYLFFVRKKTFPLFFQVFMIYTLLDLFIGIIRTKPFELIMQTATPMIIVKSIYFIIWLVVFHKINNVLKNKKEMSLYFAS